MLCTKKHKGKLDVICGSMFSGKTEELIRRLRRSTIAQLKTQIFKQGLDVDRVMTECLYSHGGNTLSATAIKTPAVLKELLFDETQVVGIDEVQFFTLDIVNVIQELVDAGKHVIVAGLDLDFRGGPFGCMPTLLALADTVTKLKAICVVCGGDAYISQRIIDGRPAQAHEPVILVGAQESYQARCRSCYEDGSAVCAQDYAGKSCTLNI